MQTWTLNEILQYQKILKDKTYNCHVRIYDMGYLFSSSNSNHIAGCSYKSMQWAYVTSKEFMLNKTDLIILVFEGDYLPAV